ncbi:hypothetical protein [Methylobacillus sp. Pita1]|uniref:hypothetical protein n=1 Tax=Methylobacillus sp. Pita1 TaxID=3382642 RepID=UPI0038B51C19
MISIVKAVRFGSGGQDVTHVEWGVIDEHDPREWVEQPQLARAIDVVKAIKNGQTVRPLFEINGLLMIGEPLLVKMLPDGHETIEMHQPYNERTLMDIPKI